MTDHGRTREAGAPSGDHAIATVALVITHGAHARLALRSAVLSHLCAEGVRVVILAPAPAIPTLREEFEGQAVGFSSVAANRRRGSAVSAAVRRWLLTDPDLNETVTLKDMAWRRRHPALHRLSHPVRRLLGRLTMVDRLWLAADRLVFPDTANAGVFRDWRPDLVVVFSLMHAEAVTVVRRARRENIRTLYVVESWDNLSGKGIFRERVDRVAVGNAVLRDEAMRFLRYPTEHLCITGSPFHDVYAAVEDYESREVVLRRLGLDPGRKTVFIAGTTDSVLPEFDDVLEILTHAQRTGRLVHPCQFVVRPHPQVYCGWDRGRGTEEDLRRYETTYGNLLAVDRPRLASRTLKADTASSDTRRLAELLHHSDVVVNAFSSISIDAAAVGTPVVLLGFDGHARKDYDQSVVRYRDYTHQRNLVRTGGARIAYGPDDLVRHVNDYLLDRDLDADGRRRIVREQCGRLDGRAAERVARCIAQFARGQWAVDLETGGWLADPFASPPGAMRAEPMAMARSRNAQG